MSSIYTPQQTYHPLVTVPGDGDLVNASNINTPIEAALDNAAYALISASTVSVLNWKAKVTDSAIASVGRATGLPTGIWFACIPGTDNTIKKLENDDTWTSEVLPSSGIKCTDIAYTLQSGIADTQVTIVTKSNKLFYFVSGGWLTTGSVLSQTPTDGEICYDRTNNLWVIAVVGPSGVQVYHSVNQTTWIAAGGSAPSWAGNTINVHLQVSSTGAWLVTAILSNVVKAAVSTDQGATWTETTVANVGITATAVSRPQWDPLVKLWAYTTNDGTTSEFFTSPDGIVWTSPSQTGVTLFNASLAISAGQWAVVNGADGNVWFSIDQAATWRPAGFELASTSNIFFGNGQFLMLSSGQSRSSLKSGNSEVVPV